MKTILIAFIMLTSCTKQSFEMEQLSEDVLKGKGQGIEIDVKPIAKQKPPSN